jgi:integrase
VSGKNANGEGTVFQRKDGRWVAAIYAPTPEGDLRKIIKYAKNRTDANRKLREMVDRIERNVPIPVSSMTVEAYLADWLQHIKQHVRPSTWRSYDLNTRQHVVPRIGRKRLTALTVRDVRLMIDRMKVDGVGARTIQYVHATIRAALEHAYREELVSRNVAKLVRVEKPRPIAKEPLSVAEARKLLSATKGDDDHAMWTVMLMLGLRRSEICGLRWGNVDLEGRTLSVTQSVQRVEGKLTELPTKTRRSTRTVPLPSGVRRALAEHRTKQQAHEGPDQPYVFGTKVGTPLEPRNLSRRWTKLCKDVGIRPVPLHSLRHSCVSLLLAQGVNPRTVMEIVGHSALEMTMNVYGHVNLETQRRALDELDRVLQ